MEYLWTNNDQKAVRIPAPQYIDYVMTWIQSQLIDEAVFPSRAGAENAGALFLAPSILPLLPSSSASSLRSAA